MPRIADSLAGRIDISRLWPLSAAEMAGQSGVVDNMFDPGFAPPSELNLSCDALVEQVVAGGFPEVVARETAVRRRAWFDSYVTSVLDRDVRDPANIDGLTQVPRLLSLLAARAATLSNQSELSRAIGLPWTTLRRYLALLEMLFLVQFLPAWSGNLGKRLTKAPKLLMADTGLAAHLLGLDKHRLLRDPNLLGPLLENMVAMELTKQAAWSENRPSLFHYRSVAGQEIDLILENGGVKSSPSRSKPANTSLPPTSRPSEICRPRCPSDLSGESSSTRGLGPGRLTMASPLGRSPPCGIAGHQGRKTSRHSGCDCTRSAPKMTITPVW